MAIVPDSLVYADETLLARLAAQLDRAVVLYRADQIHAIFSSGGTGHEGIDEARAMRRYLLTRQVPARAMRRR